MEPQPTALGRPEGLYRRYCWILPQKLMMTLLYSFTAVARISTGLAQLSAKYIVSNLILAIRNGNIHVNLW